ncbi:MAG: hypothetical protein NC187_10220 [Candidatus Amulumruptor caecigallinarius]|nr:hypothetical protein [Candidatus Amulumruptor caecigallinarius]MCM1397840.1 hypothetical protein [Candidatus Amulumruptor caecigallinarius]MCM1453970.1 hypothetical protein [bacterium]
MKLNLTIIALLSSITLSSLVSNAQTAERDSTVNATSEVTQSATGSATDIAQDTHIMYIDVPENLNIKDKIFLVNKSQTTILQSAVALKTGKTLSPLGSTTIILPGGKATMASFSHNKLKRLKGQTIALKIKGVRKALSDVQSTGIAGGSFTTGSFGVGIVKNEIRAEELNNIDPALITYDYTPQLSEANHDLYITVSSGSNTFDF